MITYWLKGERKVQSERVVQMATDGKITTIGANQNLKKDHYTNVNGKALNASAMRMESDESGVPLLSITPSENYTQV